MPNQVSNSQAFDVVTVTAKDREKTGYRLGKDIKNGQYTFTTIKVAPSQREPERSVVHVMASTGDPKDDFPTCLMLSHLINHFKTDAALLSAGHLEDVQGTMKWKVAAVYSVEVINGIIKFL